MTKTRVILITGADGTLGSAATVACCARGDRVIALGRRKVIPAWLPSGAVYATADIRDESRLAEIMTENSVDSVFHFASLKNVGESERIPLEYCSVNIDGTRAVLSAMKAAGVQHIVFASTWAVYASCTPVAQLNESSPVGPASTYALTKLLGERFIQEYAEKKWISDFQILRLANLVGPAPSASGVNTFLDIALDAARKGKPITLSGIHHPTSDGSMARDFVDIRDVLRLMQLLPGAPSGTFNVGSGKATTLKQVIAAVEEVTDTKVSLVVQESKPGALASVVVESALAKKMFGWEPSVGLLDSIRAL